MSGQLILNSRGGNYQDYYDHHFDTNYSSPAGTPVWFRNSRPFPDRQEMFSKFKEYSIPAPMSGLVDQTTFMDDDTVVVYTDETYHQGMFKELVSFREAKSLYKDKFCSKYIYSEDVYRDRNAGRGTEARPPYQAVSRRYLMIGDQAWTLEYRSWSDWRSNVGEVDIDVLGPLEDKELRDKLIRLMIEYKSPIFALDVVPQSEDCWLATDLNLAPGMHNCGIKELVGPKQACDLIKDFYFKYCQ